MGGSVQLFVPLVSGLAVAVFALVGGQLVAFFRRPKLRIDKDVPELGEGFSCHAILVKNAGLTTAEKCIGTLTIPELTGGDLLTEPLTLEELHIPLEKFGVVGKEAAPLLSSKNFRPVNGELLAWSRIGNPVEVNIPPGAGTMLDLCRYMYEVKDGKVQIDLPSEKGWNPIRAVLKAQKYTFTVTVHADNARQCQRSFKVVHGEASLTISAAPDSPGRTTQTWYSILGTDERPDFDLLA